jgi:hypothetical protein
MKFFFITIAFSDGDSKIKQTINQKGDAIASPQSKLSTKHYCSFTT